MEEETPKLFHSLTRCGILGHHIHITPMGKGMCKTKCTHCGEESIIPMDEAMEQQFTAAQEARKLMCKLFFGKHFSEKPYVKQNQDNSLHHEEKN